MKIKRYQCWNREGLSWSKWFQWNGTVQEKWQLKNKQKNEYKEVTEEEWLEIQNNQ